jgi:hypothetical protein
MFSSEAMSEVVLEDDAPLKPFKASDIAVCACRIAF